MNIKNTLVIVLAAVILSLAAALLSNLLVLSLFIPGSLFLAYTRKHKVSLVAKVINSGTVEYRSSLTGNVSNDKVSALKEDVSRHLVDQLGVEKDTALSAVSLRDRLMWSKEEWLNLVESINLMREQGYPKVIIDAHLRLVEASPTFRTMDLVKEMVGDYGIRDWAPLRCVLSDESYNLEKFEIAIYAHEVDGLDWGRALSLSMVPA